LRITPIFSQKIGKIAENCQKSQKIVIITSTPDLFYVQTEAESFPRRHSTSTKIGAKTGKVRHGKQKKLAPKRAKCVTVNKKIDAKLSKCGTVNKKNWRPNGQSAPR
jgi:hypothetical protein